MARRAHTPFALAMLLAAACGSEPKSDPDAPAPSGGLDPEITAAETAERKALEACGPVTAEGYCGVRLGMAPEAAHAAFPVALENYDVAPPTDIDPMRCFELFAIEPVTGISMLAEGGVIQRIDFLTATARTAEGLGVGSAAAAIRARFGDAITQAPNAFEPEITNYVAAVGEAKFIFEMENGVVRSWRVGLSPAIDYPAHCAER